VAPNTPRSQRRGKRESEHGNTSKVKDVVRVVRAEDMEKKHSLTRESYILYEMLAGADYDKQGLPGCGHEKALVAAQSEHGLVTSLC
jgi:hypothetical protein